MKEHNITWYESEDGKVFSDECKCMMYEINILYHASGIRFFNGRKPIKDIKIIDTPFSLEDTVSYATRMTIDRDKYEANKAFIDAYNKFGCACDIVDAFYGRIDAYGYVKHSTGYSDKYDFYNGSKPVYGTEYIATPFDGSKRMGKAYESDFICKKQLNKCPVCGVRKTLKPYNHRVDEWEEHSCEWMCSDCYKDPGKGKRKKICMACGGYSKRYLSPCKECVNA